MIVWALLVYGIARYVQRRRNSRAVIPLFSLDGLDVCQRSFSDNDAESLLVDVYEDYDRFCRLFKAELRHCRVLDAQSSQNLREVKKAISARDLPTVVECLTKWISATSPHLKIISNLLDTGALADDTAKARLRKIKDREVELFNMVNASRLGLFSWENVKRWRDTKSWTSNSNGNQNSEKKSELIEERRQHAAAIKLLERWRLMLREEVELVHATMDREVRLVDKIQDIITQIQTTGGGGGWDALTDMLVESFDEILEDWKRTGDYYWQQF